MLACSGQSEDALIISTGSLHPAPPSRGEFFFLSASSPSDCFALRVAWREDATLHFVAKECNEVVGRRWWCAEMNAKSDLRDYHLGQRLSQPALLRVSSTLWMAYSSRLCVV